MEEGEEKKNKSFKRKKKGALQGRLNRVLTLAHTPTREVKDPAPQFTSFTRMDNHLALPPSGFVIQYEVQTLNHRKLAFSSNKFTVMKIHNSFDFLFSASMSAPQTETYESIYF